MAALFLLMTLIIVGVYFGSAKKALIGLLVTLGLCALMLWHHATDILQINW